MPGMDQVMLTLAVIGAGPLGRRLAFEAAKSGFRVMLEDVMPSNLRHAEEALREALGPEAMPLVGFARTVEEAVREAENCNTSSGICLLYIFLQFSTDIGLILCGGIERIKNENVEHAIRRDRIVIRKDSCRLGR